jgi:hypothetical protein
LRQIVAKSVEDFNQCVAQHKREITDRGQMMAPFPATAAVHHASGLVLQVGQG